MNHVQDLMRPAGGSAVGPRQPDSVDLPVPLDIWVGFRRGLAATFALFVLAPSVLVFLYLALIASPQYEAEAQFVLRGDVNRPGAVGSPAGMVGALNVTQEGSIFVRYLTSRALIEALGETLDLKAVYARDGIDWLSQLDGDADGDAVADYWSDKASAIVDPLSGAVTLKVRAFTTEEALAINQAVMTASERMLNHLLDGSRRDALRIAEQDRERAAEALEAIRREVETFRRDSGLLDPAGTGEQTIDLIFALRSQRAALSAQLQGALASLSPMAPQVRALRARLAALDAQIAALEEEMTKGTAAGNLPALISAYDALELKRGFAERSFTRSELTLLRTKAEIEQWHVYLTVFSPPTLTVEPVAPTPLWTAFVVFLSTLVVWTILALLAAGTMDHRQ
jgi:capsular polysaccharide transport system permease protein